jgi:hypothetical protein
MAKSIITPVATLSYPALFAPKAGLNGQEAQYGCALVFAPGTDLTELKQAAGEAMQEKWGAKALELLRGGKLRMPFREDSVDKGYPEGSIFINVKSKTKPGIVGRFAGADGKPVPITREEDIYPGCQVRASLRCFAYDTNGNRGVSFSLGNLQKLADGDRLDGRKRAEDEFDALAGAEAEPVANLASML